MKTQDHDLIVGEFVALLEEPGRMNGEDISFIGICRRLGVAPEVLDGHLYCTFGTKGAEIIDVFRYNVPLSMLQAGRF